MGVFTPEGRLVPAMADKYRQICRFVELVADVVGEGPRDGRPFRAVDFGCGKSYLTFIVYHYLTVVRGLSVEMTGLDLKADVIAHCNEAAAASAMADSISRRAMSAGTPWRRRRIWS